MAHGSRPDKAAVVAQCPEQLGVLCPLCHRHAVASPRSFTVVDPDKPILIVAATGPPPRPALGIGIAQVMVDDPCHVECRLHGEVVASATANLLVVLHDAQFGLPESDVVFPAGVAECLAYFFHIRDRGVGPIAMS